MKRKLDDSSRLDLVEGITKLLYNYVVVYGPKHVARNTTNKGKGKAVPLQAQRGPEDSRKLRLPYLMTTAQDRGKVVSFTHRPPLPPGNAPGTHFC